MFLCHPYGGMFLYQRMIEFFIHFRGFPWQQGMLAQNSMTGSVKAGSLIVSRRVVYLLLFFLSPIVFTPWCAGAFGISGKGLPYYIITFHKIAWWVWTFPGCGECSITSGLVSRFQCSCKQYPRTSARSLLFISYHNLFTRTAGGFVSFRRRLKVKIVPRQQADDLGCT